jgi:ribonuclease D
MAAITNFLHTYDLPADVSFQGALAIDTEAMGLNNKRDRLCVVQISDGNGDAHLVHFPSAKYDAPNLKRVLSQPVEKILHFARFDVAIIQEYLGVLLSPVYCTRTASRLIRTYTDRHGLKDLCKEILAVEISKQQQSSDWGADTLSKEQIDYAASDVLYLHQLKVKLEERLTREGRSELARMAMDCIPARAMLDLAGWSEVDIFGHS